jgi:hypothetical protein
MAIVDNDEVVLGIEFRSPGFAWRALERVTGQAPRRRSRRIDLREQFVRHGDQGLARARDVALANRDPDGGKFGLFGRSR